MQESEALKPTETDENSLKKAVEMVFNEVYIKIVPNKSFEDQNLIKFDEKFQKAISYITTPKVYSEPVHKISAKKNSFVGCVFDDPTIFWTRKNRSVQKRKRHLDNSKKQALVSRRVSKQDDQRSKEKFVNYNVFSRPNMYASKKGPKWQRNNSLSKSFMQSQNFKCLPIVPDVTEVIVNKRRKNKYTLYQPYRKINLDHLWMMHWKLKHQKKVNKKYSTKHILLRMFLKCRNK
ncbi:hypothetical protein PMAC_001296 [Pneumocystis sp. 'macacae']|nr:hypothetical protein PMAC_001296 [Pneumocystis sp. 'macacae']